jgi:hypothetical protein
MIDENTAVKEMIARTISDMLTVEFEKGRKEGYEAGYNLCLNSLIQYRDRLGLSWGIEGDIHEELSKAVDFLEGVIKTATEGKV